MLFVGGYDGEHLKTKVFNFQKFLSCVIIVKIEFFRFHNGYTIPPYNYILYTTETTQNPNQDLKPKYNLKYGYANVHQLVEGSWIGR